MNRSRARSAPWHLWIVGLVGLLWNSFGAYDYAMSKLQGEPYLRQAGMTDAQISHFLAMPNWMTAVWAVGVWGALAGTLLLLARSALAAPVFIASLIAFVISLVYGHVVAPIPDAGVTLAVMQGAILAGCMFFAWYAFAMRRAGVLR